MKKSDLKSSKQVSYRLRPEVSEFLERNSVETHRSIQGMLDVIMDKIMEMEAEGIIKFK